MVSLSNHAHPPGFRIKSGNTTADAGPRLGRRHRRAHLDRADASYILNTFPIVRREDQAQFDSPYRTRDLILAYMNALAAGDSETIVAV